jgi:gas vesicle protein
MGRNGDREVVYVERGGDASAKWFLWGALLGAGVALFYAPSTGEQTRRSVQRRLRKLRAMAEEKLDELGETIGTKKRQVADEFTDAAMDAGDAVEEGLESARSAVERRLEAARARRRAAKLAELDEELEDEAEESGA